jgi:hypothetical protein
MSNPTAPDQETQPEQPLEASPAAVEDDFGDEKLGERQPQACSLEEGCVVCQ